MKKWFLFSFVFSIFLCSVFSQEVINPSEGVWANKQILVLDVPENSVAYYSVSGNDPESSGFAYDGPVLLDVDGQVFLKVVIVDASGNRFSKNVLYTVKNAENPTNEEALNFIKSYVDVGVVNYTAGEDFSIPASLEYSVGGDSKVFEDGKTISISQKSIDSRFVPCAVSDKKSFWRFIIRVEPAISGVYTRRDVPFEITDWETITFTDKKMIYKIDDAWWDAAKLPIKIDRSKSHMISWQPLEYSEENPVKFFVLPPKPEINQEKDETGSVFVSYKGDTGYRFGVLQKDGTVSELYDSFAIDTFQGDFYSGVFKAGVFYDSVYQGDFNISFAVNKRLPQKPIITSSAENGFSRRIVTLNIQSPQRAELFASVQGPIFVDSDDLTNENAVLFNFQNPDYKKLETNKIVLHPSNDGAVAYKVFVYSEDDNKNKSGISTYEVVIDSVNYYVDASAKIEDLSQDGTKEKPFSNFDKVLPFINENRFVSVILSGEIVMPEKTWTLSSNLQINGKTDARVRFPKKSNVLVKNASFSFANCLISYEDKNFNDEESEISNTLIQLDRAVLDLNNAEVVATFSKNGTFVSAENSVVSVRDTRITVSSQAYACVIVSVDSKINIKKSNLTTVSPTCINFSAQGGLFSLVSSNCKVVGVSGRIGELFDTQSSISNNNFLGDLKKNQNPKVSVYMDAKNVSIEYAKNVELGF